MKRYKILLYLFVLIATLSCSTKKMYQAPQIGYLTSVTGLWKGKLIVTNKNADTTSVSMSLDVKPTSDPKTYTWTMQYGPQPPRLYNILINDEAKGMYTVDEQNSILIPARKVGNELVSNYEVMGSQMTIIHDSVSEDEMLFKVNMWRPIQNSVSGDTVQKGDTIPKVTSFMPVAYQIARLKRVK